MIHPKHGEKIVYLDDIKSHSENGWHEKVEEAQKSDKKPKVVAAEKSKVVTIEKPIEL